MKKLQERMVEMKPYFKGVEMYNDALIVKVMFPQRWKIYDSSDSRIKVVKSETTDNEVFYYASSENTSYDDMFDLIEETIKANKDLVLKVKLLKEKVEELKELFYRLTYDELATLRFVTETSNSTKGKRKYTKKKKEPQSDGKCEMEAVETPTEEPTENMEGTES